MLALVNFCTPLHFHFHILTLTPSRPHTTRTHTLTLSHHHTLLEDLWAHLGEASGQPVATVMSTWTQQMGYPVLMVEGRQVRGWRCDGVMV